MTNRIVLSAAAVLGTAMAGTTVQAQTTYDWTASLNGQNSSSFSASGQLVVTSGSVTSISGSWDGISITGLAAVGAVRARRHCHLALIDSAAFATRNFLEQSEDLHFVLVLTLSLLVTVIALNRNSQFLERLRKIWERSVLETANSAENEEKKDLQT